MENEIKRIARQAGAASVGISSTERLQSGVPSMDPTYVLPSARSIVSVMLPLDGDIIRRYLGKVDHDSLQVHETEVYRKLYGISRKIAAFLKTQGYEAVAVEPNLDYRFKDGNKYRRVPYEVRQKLADWLSSPSGPLVTSLKRLLVEILFEKSTEYTDWNLTPSFSHRYGAVAAGLGIFGWSSNVMTPEYGARVLFDTVITNAVLLSDVMMENTPCDGCRICTRVCQVGMMHPKMEDHVTIGDRRFIHAKKGHNLRCIFCCAGFTGQDLHKKWSTWSPGRISLPGDDNSLESFWNSFAKSTIYKHNYYAKTLSDLQFHTEYGLVRKPYDRFMTTCGNCQMVCWETLEQRKENYDILVRSGVVVEGPNFSFKVIRTDA
jgi:epoxyqueuosine reductase